MSENDEDDSTGRRNPLHWVVAILTLVIVLSLLTGCADVKKEVVAKGAEAADTLATEALADYYFAKAKLCLQVGQSAAYRVMPEPEADELHAWCKNRGLTMREVDAIDNDPLAGSTFLPDGVVPVESSTLSE